MTRATLYCRCGSECPLLWPNNIGLFSWWEVKSLSGNSVCFVLSSCCLHAPLEGVQLLQLHEDRCECWSFCLCLTGNTLKPLRIGETFTSSRIWVWIVAPQATKHLTFEMFSLENVGYEFGRADAGLTISLDEQWWLYENVISGWNSIKWDMSEPAAVTVMVKRSSVDYKVVSECLKLPYITTLDRLEQKSLQRQALVDCSLNKTSVICKSCKLTSALCKIIQLFINQVSANTWNH